MPQKWVHTFGQPTKFLFFLLVVFMLKAARPAFARPSSLLSWSTSPPCQRPRPRNLPPSSGRRHQAATGSCWAKALKHLWSKGSEGWEQPTSKPISNEWMTPQNLGRIWDRKTPNPWHKIYKKVVERALGPLAMVSLVFRSSWNAIAFQLL